MGVRKKRAQRPPSPLSYYDFGAVVKRIPSKGGLAKAGSTGNLSQNLTGFPTGPLAGLDTSALSAVTRSVQMMATGATGASRASLGTSASALLQTVADLDALAPVDVVRGEHRKRDRTVKTAVESRYPPMVTGDPGIDRDMPTYSASEMLRGNMIATRASVERLASGRLSPAPHSVVKSLRQSWASLAPTRRTAAAAKSRASTAGSSEASGAVLRDDGARRAVRSASAEHMLEPIFCPTGCSQAPPLSHAHEFIRCSKLNSLFSDHPSFSMQERAFRAAEDLRRGREREKMEREARELHLAIRELERAKLLERQRAHFWEAVERREPHALRQLRELSAIRDEDARRDVGDFELESGPAAAPAAAGGSSEVLGARLSNLPAAAAQIALLRAARRAASGSPTAVDPRRLYGATGMAYVSPGSKGPDSLEEPGTQMTELEQFGERVRAMQAKPRTSSVSS
eukprot:tig00021435_g21396.t1